MKMQLICNYVLLGLLTLASKLNLGEGKRDRKDLLLQVRVPANVREGNIAILQCLHNVENDKLYSMKWYKGPQEFFRFTPKESPPIKTFPSSGIEVDLRSSNSSVVALTNVDLNMTARYTCEVTKDFPDYYTAVRTMMMNVIAIPEHKPVITTDRRSVSVGDNFSVNCTSFRSKPVANITWLLNGLPVHPHYLAHEIKDRDDTTKESITVGLNFTVRQQHFIKSRMTLTCQANIEPDMYTGSTDVIIVEHVRPKLSSVVDKYSSPATEGASDRMSNSGSLLLTTSAAVPLAQLCLAVVNTSAHKLGVYLSSIMFSSWLLSPLQNIVTFSYFLAKEDFSSL